MHEVSELLNSTYSKVVGVSSPLIQDIVSWYLEKGMDQKKSYVFKNNFSSDIHWGEMKRFGLYNSSDDIVRDKTTRDYVVFIPDNIELSEFPEYISSFVKTYLPEDIVPTYFYYGRELHSSLELEMVLDRARAVYRSIENLSDYSNIKLASLTNLGMARVSDTIARNRMEALDITSSVNRLMAELNGANRDTLSIMKEEGIKIKKQCGPRTIVHTREYHRQEVCYFFAYLYCEHKIVCELPSHYQILFDNILGRMFFHPQAMMVEDIVRYVKELPPLMFKNTTFGSFFVLFDSKRTLEASVRRIPRDSLNPSPEKAVVNLTEANILEIRDFYNFDGVDYREEVMKLDAHMRKLGEVVGEVIHVTNFLMTEEEGVVYLNYIERLDADIPAIIFPRVPKELEARQTQARFSLSMLRGMLPVRLAYKEISFIARLKKRLEEAGGKFTSPDPYLVDTYKGLIYRGWSNLSGNVLVIPDNEGFLALGLWGDALNYRTSALDELSKELNLLKLRKESRAFDLFGGPHPRLGSPIVVTEKNSRE